MPMKILTSLTAGLLLVLLAIPVQAAGLREVIQALETPFQAGTPADRRIQDYTADFFQESRIASLDRLQRARGEVSVRFDYRRSQVPLVMFHWEYREPTTQEIISDGKTLWVYLPENNQVIQSDIEMISKAGESDPMTFLTGLGQLSRDFLISWAEPNRDVEGNYVLDLRPRRTTALINRMVIVVDRYALEESSTESSPKTPSAVPSGRPSRSSRGGGFFPTEPDANQTVAQERNDFFDDDFDPNKPITDDRAAAPTADPFFANKGRSSSFLNERRRTGGLVFPILSTTVYDPSGNRTTIEFNDLRINRGISASQFRFIQPAGVEVVRPTGKGMGL